MPKQLLLLGVFLCNFLGTLQAQDIEQEAVTLKLEAGVEIVQQGIVKD